MTGFVHLMFVRQGNEEKHCHMQAEAGLFCSQVFNEQSLTFQEKLIARGGLGNETYLPDGEQPLLECI